MSASPRAGARLLALSAAVLLLAVATGCGIGGTAEDTGSASESSSSAASPSDAGGASDSGGGATASPSDPAAPSAASSPAVPPATAPASPCPEGVTLPAGADPRACGPLPADATPLTLRGFGYYSFAMPSGIAGCDIADGILTCRYTESDWQHTEPEIGGECTGYSISDAAPSLLCPTDAPLWMDAEPDRPAYGEVVTASSFACIVAEEGLTCWNGNSGHGMKLSRSEHLTW